MRFLANENFPRPSVRDLRAAGHDVLFILEGLRRLDDPAIIRRARQESRIILTFDKDYYRHIFKAGMPAPLGVVHFRFAPSAPHEPAQRLLNILNTGQLHLEGHFTVLWSASENQQPLP